MRVFNSPGASARQNSLTEDPSGCRPDPRDRGGGRRRAVENGHRASRPRRHTSQKPHDRPKQSKKSPAPFCHAASKAVRHELYEAYAWFVGCFRQAAKKWKAGDLTASFPYGSVPPADRL